MKDLLLLISLIIFPAFCTFVQEAALPNELQQLSSQISENTTLDEIDKIISKAEKIFTKEKRDNKTISTMGGNISGLTKVIIVIDKNGKVIEAEPQTKDQKSKKMCLAGNSDHSITKMKGIVYYYSEMTGRFFLL